ncbi:hypothetical protein MHTCC0001_17970 [Flavobacteriaceae bacterium MHTCC 0001]
MKNLVFLVALFTILISYGQELASYSASHDPACSGIVSSNANVTADGICRGPGLNFTGTPIPYRARGWTSSSSIDVNDYFEWTITPNSGFQLDLSSLDISYHRNPRGPRNIDLQINTGSGFTSIFTDDLTFTIAVQTHNISLSSYTGLTGTVTFRLYGYNSGIGRLLIDENTATDKGILINGTVSPISACPTTTTWNGSWDNGAPNSSTNAIINSTYNTSTNGQIDACTITVSNNATLTVANNTYLNIENEITVDTGSTIAVEEYGAVVQNDDASVNVNNGTISVSKVTAPMNAWYEYTYWSSPVSGETIANAITGSNPNRRYIFNGQNFLDATAETNNDNSAVAGQDDIDDNGDDWQWVSGTTVMAPGVGYAMTLTSTEYNLAPGTSDKTFRYTYTGAFNNGIITVPVYRNDSEVNDNNWNLIGNPYPSAIDADLFITGNPSLSGAIYLWSQNTPPSSTNNGNESQNFSDSDYAIINGASYSAGGDGVMPNGFIPSGQAFFVSMDDAASATLVAGDVYTADVTFNNSMRDSGAGNNSQFFKYSGKVKKNMTATDNKLWIDLTSDNGVFNQISIAYVDGATHLDDGAYYDAPKVVTSNTLYALYSIIENSDKKFVIQGKATNSLNENEIVKLGFKTSIDVATLYKLSITDLKGAFMQNNAVYLKDNLENKIHNLTDADYTFTSEVGEFNNRFEIVFSANTLSNDAIALKNALNIAQLDSENIQFSSDRSSIKNIAIFDALGRTLYTLTADSNSETFNLSKLKSAVYIATVELANGATVSKKFIKN